jgi:hypothetical protein
MKRYALPLLSVTGGAGCFILRLLQNRTAFEPDTGLPIPGHPLSILLPAVLVLLAAAAFLPARRHRDAVSPDLREGFCGAPAALILAATGIVLWLCSAAAVVLPGQPEVTPTPEPEVTPEVTPTPEPEVQPEVTPEPEQETTDEQVTPETTKETETDEEVKAGTELLAKALKNSEITESYKYVKTLDKTAESCTILANLDGVDYDVTINADGLVNTINAHVAK